MGSIQIGKLYRHFKGDLYQVICQAKHSETGEELIIYQALYGDFKVYARPKEMFFQVLDKAQYPESSQVHRFEAVEDAEGCLTVEAPADTEKNVGVKAEEKSDTGLLVIMKFLDCETSKEKLEIIHDNYSKIDLKTINNIEASMDIISDTDDLDARISYVCDVLRTRAQYENTRLR